MPDDDITYFIILMLIPDKWIAFAILKCPYQCLDYFLNYSEKSVWDVISVVKYSTLHATNE